MKKIIPFPGPIERVPPYWKMKLSEEQIEWLRMYYPVKENRWIMKKTGLRHSALHRFARQLKLAKSEEGMKGIIKRTAKIIRNINVRNGYNDSIRGQRPGEACQKAIDKMWQEIREGKREHPHKIWRRNKPKEYAAFRKKLSAGRSEQIRKERMRMAYGLRRQTKLRVVLNPYTTSQRNHRSNAYKRGYILMTGSVAERYNIYYDEETQRAEIFERNLINDGFSVKEYRETDWRKAGGEI